MCTPHLAQAKIDGVEQRSAALGHREHHAALQVFHAVGELAGQFGALVKAHQKKLVLGIGSLEELHGGFAGLADLVGHAAAVIKDHADGDGDVFGGESDDFLLDVVFVDAKIVGFEAGDQAVVGVGDSHVDEGEVDIKFDGLAGLERRTHGIFPHVTYVDLLHFPLWRSVFRLGFFGRRLSGGGKCGLQRQQANEQRNLQ